MACPKPNTAKQHGVFIISQIKLVKFFFCIQKAIPFVVLYKRVLNLVAVVPIVSFLYYSLLHFLSCLSVQKRTHLVTVVQLYPSFIIPYCTSFFVFLYKRELILSQQFSIILPVLFFVFTLEYFVFQLKFFHSSSFKRVYPTSSTPNQTLTL